MNYVINKMLQCMQTNNLIEEEDVELYQYGIHLLILKFLHYCSILVLGFFLGRVWQLLIFLVCYTVLRSYTGGFHAKHSGTCLLISIMMILVLHLTIDVITNDMALLIASLSIAVIMMLSPIVSKELPLDEKELRENRRISIILSILLFILFITLYITNLRELYLPIGYSLFYTSFYLLIPFGIKVMGRARNE